MLLQYYLINWSKFCIIKTEQNIKIQNSTEKKMKIE